MPSLSPPGSPQSFSVVDQCNPAGSGSDLTGLVTEPNLSGRSHTLIFSSSSEVSALLVVGPHRPPHRRPGAAQRGFSQAAGLSEPTFNCECTGSARALRLKLRSFVLENQSGGSACAESAVVTSAVLSASAFGFLFSIPSAKRSVS